MVRKSELRNSDAKSKAKPGTIRGRIKPEPQAGMQEAPAGVQSMETEDPRQVGSGKRAQRELLERNVGEGGAAQDNPDAAAGLHSTGSFTGRKRRAS
jgi:hypothetical protein